MSSSDPNIQKAIDEFKDNCMLWFKNDLISTVYFPTNEELEKSYFYFLVILNSTENLNVEFWIEYYQHIESKWDSYWKQFFDLEIIPKLSLNFRSQKSIEEKLLLINSPDDPYQILYDKNNFFQTFRESVVKVDKNGNIYTNGDTIWI